MLPQFCKTNYQNCKDHVFTDVDPIKGNNRFFTDQALPPVPIAACASVKAFTAAIAFSAAGESDGP